MNKQNLHQLLATWPNLQLAFLFGSVAQGTATADSDLDLAVLFPTPMTAASKQQFISELALLSGRPVDLIDLRTASVPLMRQVLNGKRVFGSRTAFGELIARYLRDVADFLPIIENTLKLRRERWINS